MINFESDLSQPSDRVLDLPTGTPDLLDEWYAENADPFEGDEDPFYDDEGPYLSDAEADADTLASAGWGTDEDYGYFGDDFDAEPPF